MSFSENVNYILILSYKGLLFTMAIILLMVLLKKIIPVREKRKEIWPTLYEVWFGCYCLNYKTVRNKSESLIFIWFFYAFESTSCSRYDGNTPFSYMYTGVFYFYKRVVAHWLTPSKIWKVTLQPRPLSNWRYSPQLAIKRTSHHGMMSALVLNFGLY